MPGKERIKIQAGSLLWFWAVHELGMNMTELSGRLNISVSSASVAVKRGEKIVNDNSISLLKLLKQKDVPIYTRGSNRPSMESALYRVGRRVLYPCIWRVFFFCLSPK